MNYLKVLAGLISGIMLLWCYLVGILYTTSIWGIAGTLISLFVFPIAILGFIIGVFVSETVMFYILWVLVAVLLMTFATQE